MSRTGPPSKTDVGAGYRVYFIRRALSVYLLLTGGDKSTQKADIRRAQKLARELKQSPE